MLRLDSHVTHTKNLVATGTVREAGVVMVSLQPHTTDRLQPLDFRTVWEILDDVLRIWIREHVGRSATTWQVAESLNVAYRKAASLQNAVSGFRKAGL